jgi:hypothetical protein
MVAKCANPACNCEFRELSKDRLFLLPPNNDFEKSTMAGKSEPTRPPARGKANRHGYDYAVIRKRNEPSTETLAPGRLEEEQR